MTGLFAVVAQSAWIYVLAALPVFLVLDHAVYLRQVRNPFRASGRTTPVSDASSQQGLSRAIAQNDRYFSLGMVALRLGLPALFLGIIAVVVGQYLFPGGLVPGRWPVLPDEYKPLFRAARYGAAGAYVYVLLNLGLRNFRQDITNGGVAWSATTLALGPLLAWTLAHFWKPATTSDGVALTGDAVFFVAGLSPRYVASFVEETVRRVWLKGDGRAQPGPAVKSLSLVSGMTPDVADRLEEEGVTEITSLAMADPLRLIRSTSYDVKLIVSWMDEALLIYYAPASYEALKKRNITGAIDLAALALSWPSKPDAKPGEWPGLDIGHPTVKEIARAAGFADTPDELAALCERLYQDAQVQLVWALFQLDERKTAAQGDASGERERRELSPEIVRQIREELHEEMLEHGPAAALPNGPETPAEAGAPKGPPNS